jgi:hypothetical protein
MTDTDITYAAISAGKHPDLKAVISAVRYGGTWATCTTPEGEYYTISAFADSGMFYAGDGDIITCIAGSGGIAELQVFWPPEAAHLSD